MYHTSKRTVYLIVCLFLVMLLSGCTNWKKKYENLLVENKNIQGQLEFERLKAGELTEQVTEGQQTIETLQKQLAENKTPSEATGFEYGDVNIDTAKGTITVTLPNAILFNSGKATLKKANSVELDHIVSVLTSKYSGRQIDVVGHTDADPIRKSKWKDNWELSAQRSLTVLRYLVDRGIPENNIRAVGCGESIPIASNATASGKAKNRRVEIVVHMR